MPRSVTQAGACVAVPIGPRGCPHGSTSGDSQPLRASRHFRQFPPAVAGLVEDRSRARLEKRGVPFTPRPVGADQNGECEHRRHERRDPAESRRLLRVRKLVVRWRPFRVYGRQIGCRDVFLGREFTNLLPTANLRYLSGAPLKVATISIEPITFRLNSSAITFRLNSLRSSAGIQYSWWTGAPTVCTV